MTSSPPAGLFARIFRERYLRSLQDYRFFYDDVTEIGNPKTAEYVFYFVPGINGTPGQMRFLLPSLTRVFGNRIYLKALHLPEFSAHRPTWEKYTYANVDRKLAQLRADLDDLLSRHDRVIVMASSNGFYDYAAVASSLPAEIQRDRLFLLWGAAAPDHFESTVWERLLFPLTGFEHCGHRWFAYPNHNALAWANPETTSSHLWADGLQRRRLRKADLESRFMLGGLEWDYLSTSQLGSMAHHVVRQIKPPLCGYGHVLVAANDGYWQGKPRDLVERTIRRYLPEARIDFKPTSHLWVVTPSHVTEMFWALKRELLPLAGTTGNSGPSGSAIGVPSTAST